jgi:sugar lactone lactonase YvrE
MRPPVPLLLSVVLCDTPRRPIGLTSRRREARRRLGPGRLNVEALEGRIVPSALSVAAVTVREGPTSVGILDPSGAASVGINGIRDIAFDNGPNDPHYGDLFVTGGLSHSVARFDWASQTYQPFVGPNSRGLDQPYGIAVGPDGNVYVSDPTQNIICRYNGATGAPLPAPGQSGTVYVSAGSGGLSNPRKIAFGSAGNLYVCSPSPTSQGQPGQILEYQGPAGSSPGAFLGVFVNITNGSTPWDLTFGPDGDLYVSLTDASINVSGYGQINYYNGSTGAPIGNGVFVQLASGGLTQPRQIVFDPSATNMYVDECANGFVNLLPQPLGQVLRYQGPSGQNPGAYVEAYITGGQGRLATPIGLARDAAGNVYVSDRDTANVTRFAPSAQAAFTVTLDSASASQVSVNYATANGTAAAGTDYTQGSGTLVFRAGVTSETIDVPITAVATERPTKTFTMNLSGATGATISRGQATGSILNRQRKFFVVDSGSVETYEYGSGGTSEEITVPRLSSDSASRGVAVLPQPEQEFAFGRVSGKTLAEERP